MKKKKSNNVMTVNKVIEIGLPSESPACHSSTLNYTLHVFRLSLCNITWLFQKAFNKNVHHILVCELINDY